MSSVQWKDTFWRFCVVGASGVLVNLSALALLQCLHIGSAMSSACAIEISILSNFLINDRWTFHQAQHSNQWWKRAGRFQMVSLVGGSIQWICFMLMNLVWLYFGFAGESWSTYWSTRQSWQSYLDVPELSYYLYVSQLVGVAVATVWNFLLNFYWTWSLGTQRNEI